jgi:fatty acid desaturase
MQTQPDWIRIAVAIGNQFHYRKRNYYLHNALNLAVLAFLLACLVGTAWLGARIPALLYIPFAGLAFGLLYFTVITLVNHEASHRMFMVARNSDRARFWNRAFGWSSCLFFAMHFREDWEKGHHEEHHLRPIENDGVIYQHLALGMDLATRCAKILFIPGYMFVYEKLLPQEHRLRRTGSTAFLLPTTAVVWAIIATVTTLTINWTVPVAAIIGLQVAAAQQQIKLSMEHGGRIGKDPNRLFRSRTSLFPLRWLLMPLNISLHFQHHLNYHVPWYDLPRYQRALRGVVPAQVQSLVFNEDVWEQIAGRKDVGVSDCSLSPAFQEETRMYPDLQHESSLGS